jgi:hypothetical protein
MRDCRIPESCTACTLLTQNEVLTSWLLNLSLSFLPNAQIGDIPAGIIQGIGDLFS